MHVQSANFDFFPSLQREDGMGQKLPKTFSARHFSLSWMAITASHKMKFLQTVRTYFEVMGIYSPQSIQCDLKLNWRNLAFLISTAEVGISSFAFFVYGANNAIEYGFSFFDLVCGFAAMSAIAVCIWKRGKFFDLMEKFESFIERREFTFLYSFWFKMNDSVGFDQTKNNFFFQISQEHGILPNRMPNTKISTKKSNEPQKHSVCFFWSWLISFPCWHRCWKVWSCFTVRIWALNHSNCHSQLCT